MESDVAGVPVVCCLRVVLRAVAVSLLLSAFSVPDPAWAFASAHLGALATNGPLRPVSGPGGIATAARSSPSAAKGPDHPSADTASTPQAADHREHLAALAQVVDIHGMLPQADFWSRLTPFSAGAIHPLDDLWRVPLLRFYFFGGGAIEPDLGRPALTMEHETLWPMMRNALGAQADPNHYFVIGADVHLNPILMPHEGLSDRYYPRREGDWLTEFYLPSALYGADVTGELFPDTVLGFAGRSRALADFLIYSQYDSDGENAFAHDNYLKDYASIESAAHTLRWQYGFDDLFDTPWTDLSGYTWSPHEPDLGVNAGGSAMALVRSWEYFRSQRYLDAARHFLINQLPRHGFHTGIWEGRRYYWFSATPELEAIKTEDPVNSVEAMVAAPLAAVGYYTGDQKMMELARGLLWYLVREWDTNGRWYYEGQENTAIRRDHPLLSQEGVCARYAMLALPYLLGFGTDVAPEIQRLTPAIHLLVTHRPDSYPLTAAAFRYVRSFVTFGKTRGLRPGDSILVRTFLQVTGGGINALTLQEKLPIVMAHPETLQITVHHGSEETRVTAHVAPDGGFSIPVGAAPYKPWDLFTLDFEGTLNTKFTVDELPMDPPTVQISTADESDIVRRGEVQDYHYQPRINAQNFLDIPRWFYFPHNAGVGE